MLNEKAGQLKIERERLLIEGRRLKEALTPLDADYGADSLRSRLSDFVPLARHAQPEELQQLLRLAVRRIEWNPAGNHKIQLYHLPKTHSLPAQKADRLGLYIDVSKDSPWRRNLEPLVFEVIYAPDGSPNLETARVRHAMTSSPSGQSSSSQY